MKNTIAVKRILTPLINNGKMRPFNNNERIPRGFKFKSSSGTSGEVTYNRIDYAWAIVNDNLKVMPSSEAGMNWSETIY